MPMNARALLPSLLLVTLAFAGCTTQDGGGPHATPTEGGPTPTPTPSPTPGGGGEGASIARVLLVDAPESVATAGEVVDVCWRVEGEGVVGHTAVHTDNVSHPDAESFQDYKGQAYYPGNGPATTTGNFTIPGVFCANVTVPATTYLRAHAFTRAPEGLPGVLSVEHVITVGEGEVDVAGDVPEVAAGGSEVEICWRAEGTGTSPHTALHTDDESHPNAESFQAYEGTAYYPGNGPATLEGNFSLPGPFCANVTMPETGALYFRAHVVHEGEGLPGELGPERVIVAASPVSLVGEVPATAPAGSTVNLCWHVVGEGTSPHTALHTDDESHPNAESFQAYEGTAYYPGNGPATLEGNFSLPGRFCADVTMPDAGTLYVRPHAVFPDEGLPGVLGEEHAIAVG